MCSWLQTDLVLIISQCAFPTAQTSTWSAGSRKHLTLCCNFVSTETWRPTSMVSITQYPEYCSLLHACCWGRERDGRRWGGPGGLGGRPVSRTIIATSYGTKQISLTDLFAHFVLFNLNLSIYAIYLFKTPNIGKLPCLSTLCLQIHRSTSASNKLTVNKGFQL